MSKTPFVPPVSLKEAKDLMIENVLWIRIEFSFPVVTSGRISSMKVPLATIISWVFIPEN